MARKEIRELIPENTVIHCSTFEKDSLVRTVLQSYGFKWASGDAMTYSFWKEYEENFCIDPFECRYCQIAYYTKIGKNIMSADDFLKIINNMN